MQVIGLVDCDPNTLTSMSSALEREGYEVITYTDGHSAIGELKTILPDLVVLAMQMPGMDGMEILRRLHQTDRIPVILLASKRNEFDEVLGLRMGADDVIHKPFSPRVLVQRVKTVLKRVTEKSGTDQKEGDAANVIIECGQLRIDTAGYVCTWKNKPVSLTRTQLSVLQAMVSRPGVVRSRAALIAAAHHDPVFIDDRAIDTQIKYLRKKLKAVDDSFDMIEALNGIGYRFKEP